MLCELYLNKAAKNIAVIHFSQKRGMLDILWVAAQ